jgi:hypothetical protein
MHSRYGHSSPQGGWLVCAHGLYTGCAVRFRNSVAETLSEDDPFAVSRSLGVAQCWATVFDWRSPCSAMQVYRTLAGALTSVHQVHSDIVDRLCGPMSLVTPLWSRKFSGRNSPPPHLRLCNARHAPARKGLWRTQSSSAPILRRPSGGA